MTPDPTPTPELTPGPELTPAPDDDDYLDGNALAGPLSEIFAGDVTAAIGECVSCGLVGPVAACRLYHRAPGLVARCPGCHQVILRLVRGPDTAWLDLRGMVRLQLPLGPG